MPRKPKPQEKKKFTVLVDGRSIVVTLYPPSGKRTSWYVYWNGLKNGGKSTGQSALTEAIKAVNDMLRNGGRKSHLADVVLTDAEFDRIQEVHYLEKVTAPEKKKKARKTLQECRKAIEAFQHITSASPVSGATAADCERFQIEALKLPVNWSIQYADNSRSRKRRETIAELGAIQPNTVLKWSRGLRAAFDRANLNSTTCIRSVVPKEKLLTENPWKQFTWIAGTDRQVQHLKTNDLVSVLDYFEAEFPTVLVAPMFLKVLLWSWARKDEIANLRWDQFRTFGDERHVVSVGKADVKKWFRLPNKLIAEGEQLRCGGEFVFQSYSEQIAEHYLKCGNRRAARRVNREFKPANFGEWMYRQVRKWSEKHSDQGVYLHHFRKTSLQLARRGDDRDRRLASDASLTAAVMGASYVMDYDEDLRHKSNRMFQRLVSALPVEVASRYGYEERPMDRVIEQLDQARAVGNWRRVMDAAARLGEFEGEGRKTA